MRLAARSAKRRVKSSILSSGEWSLADIRASPGFPEKWRLRHYTPRNCPLDGAYFAVRPAETAKLSDIRETVLLPDRTGR